MRLKSFFTILLLSPVLLYSQLAMEGWRTHFSYNTVKQVEQTSSQVFAVADGAIFSVDKSSNEISLYSKQDGLNDFYISKVKYNSEYGMLLISYINGNVDILNSNGVANIPDIEKKAVSVNKMANDIVFDKQYAYLSCGIGIVVLNLNKMEVKDSYIIGDNSNMKEVYSTAFLNDSIYAITANELYSADKNNKFLANYENWKKTSNLPNPAYGNRILLNYQDNIYLLKSSGEVYKSSDMINWSLFDFSEYFTGLRISDNQLLLSYDKGVVRYNENLNREIISNLKNKDAIYNSSDNEYWFASDSTGLTQFKAGEIINKFLPDGPASNQIVTLNYFGNRLFALTGGPREIEKQDLPGAVMIYEKEKWKNIVKQDIEEDAEKEFIVLTQVAADKNDATHFFVSSYREGLYEFRNDKYYKRYNYQNSGLVNASNQDSDDYNAVDGVCFDQDNNLWMNNFSSTSPDIKILLNDSSWISNNYTEIQSKTAWDKIMMSSNHFKWMNFRFLSTSHGGVFVVDDKEDPQAIYYHRKRLFEKVTDQDGNEVEMKDVSCMLEDKDGDIWIGSDNGPIIFKNIEDVFSSDYTVYRPKIARRDGTDYADYLLDGQAISALAVDGANRKWIGTFGSGLYLMSDDGLKTIHHFTKDNSPLFSNNILSIAVNQKTGEVFISTDQGLMSFQSDATEANEDYTQIEIYPNPIRESFNGLITFKGMTENTVFKITDASGNIVYQGRSNAGTATWNGYTDAGNKASTGVYFIMVTDASEQNQELFETGLGKFLIIK